jgi:hypothetical protein
MAPRRPPKYHLVTSERLYALGLELMDGAVAAADAARRISKAHAFQYRDGLVIGLTALIAPRSRTLTAMRIGKQLIKTGDLWALDIPAADTKSRRALDYPIAAQLGRLHRCLSRSIPQPHPWSRKARQPLGIQSRASHVRGRHL